MKCGSTALRNRAWSNACALCVAFTFAFYSAAIGSENSVIVIGDDRGGVLQDRLAEISGIRTRSDLVEIRASVCFSACTLYLGLERVCVSRSTQFGFHDPIADPRSGLVLLASQRAFWREQMLSSYPSSLRRILQRRSTERARNMLVMSGAELIALGFAECG